MSLDQAIFPVLSALIGSATGILVERRRAKREREKETNTSIAALEGAKISDEASKRREIDEAARDIRDFLRREVADLNSHIDRIEIARADEREKWHQMLGDLSTKNLELELQHRRDMARIDQLEEEARVIDADMKTFRVRVVTIEGEAMTLKAHLDRCQRECARLRRDQEIIKNL